jgi:hypothetical protein
VTFTSGNWGLDKTRYARAQSDALVGTSSLSSPTILDVNNNGDNSLGAFTRNGDQDYFCNFSANDCYSCPRITNNSATTTFVLDLGSSMPVNSIYWAELETSLNSGTHFGGAVEVRVGSN